MYATEEVQEEAWLYSRIKELDDIIQQFGAKVVAEGLSKPNAAALFQAIQDRLYVS